MRQWRSLGELAGDAAWDEALAAEFPSIAADLAGPDRRRVLKLMAASLALAGLGGCEPEEAEKIIPYVRDPLQVEPGQPLMYASAHCQDGIANGILVRTVNGRPIKIEGNPGHPVSRGGTDAFMQASILDLYDPDRSQAVTWLGRVATFQALDAAVAQRVAALRADRGRGLRILTGPLTSPATIAQLEELLTVLPEARWHVHAPIARDAVYEGARLAFGRPLGTVLHPQRADLVVSLDGDLLDSGPQQVALSGAWMTSRRRAAAEGRLAELHAAWSTPSLTGAKADHGISVGAGRMAGLTRSLLDRIDGSVRVDGEAAGWVERAAAALAAHRGRSIVTTGGWQPAEVHALVHHLNARLGNIGRTVTCTAPLFARAADADASIEALAAAMGAGDVRTLVMLDVNPVYTAPAELEFARLLDRIDLSLHLGSHLDETAVRCRWHVPLAHALESWGDARALDGTVSLVQPTIRPLYAGRSPLEMLSLLRDGRARPGLDLLRGYWLPRLPAADPEAAWRRALHDGFVEGTALPEVSPTLRGPPPAPSRTGDGLELVFRPDPTLWDGSRANNSWLQELPKPLTKLVWDNVVGISPALAAERGLADGDLVEVTAGGRSLQGPAWVMPGQAPGTVSLMLGSGRTRAGQVASRVGYDAYALRSAAAPWRMEGVELRAVGGRAELATTQELHTMRGHEFVRTVPLGEVIHEEEHPSLYPSRASEPHAWGMVIDLDSCIGCNACVTACQSENNIPVVGKGQVAMGRDMHWLRIDRYYEGEAAAPVTRFQPVPCMHCEHAPCELGCPVEAAVHDHEGLNLQVYNRCVGTRTCQSYCPYKVRRFNYLDYTGGAPPSIRALRNPEVTVRSRGVMEKCTYCLQRIAGARITADIEGRTIREGEVVTACQGACPTRAITFGNLNDPGSAVSAARRSPRHYALLEELNTRPRTTYLAGLRPDDRTEDGS